MRFFTDLRRGLLAASSLATLQVALPAHAQQYPAYPQTAQPYAQAAGQNPYAALPQPTAQPAAQPYAATQPVTTVATQPVASTAPYQQFSAARQQAAVATQQATQQYNAGVQQAGQVGQQVNQQYNATTQQAAGQYNAAVQYVAARPATTAVAPTVVYPTAPVQQPAVQSAAPQMSAFQQVYPNAAPPVAQQQPVYQQPVYTARAMQNPVPEAVQNLPLTPPTEAVPPGAVMPATQPGVVPQPVPMPEGGYPQAGGYESYPSGYGSGAGCATGNCAPYGAAEVGCEPSMTDRMLCRNDCNYWFGGVYGLLMQRDAGDKYNLGMTDGTMPPSGYPSMPNVVLTSADVDPGYQGGVEFRLGRTFGGVADPCSCGPCCPTWGVEGVYWELFEDSESADYMPSTSRYYSMMPMPGLQYDGGSGWMPVNEYWDYGPPVDGPGTPRVTYARTSSSFQARNVEVNFLRLNLCGCAPMCGPCGGCDGGMSGMVGMGGACGVGGCDTGYCAPNRYNITGVCGVRYLELDDYFMYGVNYVNGGNQGFLNYNSTAENKLVGFQFGSNAMYRIGCKWGVHLNSLVGLYGNDIDTHQYFNSPTGMIRYASTGEAFDANASKTDVAMLGELRLGASYQMTCRCRLYGGWRAMGLTGVALATNQAPNQWLTPSQGASYVNSSGSMIIHGLQTGVEWNY